MAAEHPRRSRRPALLVRFPGFRRKPGRPVVDRQDLEGFPLLAEDLGLWAELHEERFRRLDDRAQHLQNQFWRQHVVLIIGGLVATSLGAVQAAAGSGYVVLAVIQAVLVGVLAGVTVLVRSRRAQQGYIAARLKAERMRSELYLFLGRVGHYAGPQPADRLQEQIDDIEAAEG